MMVKVQPSVNLKRPNNLFYVLSQIWLGLKWYCNHTSLHGFHYITRKKSSSFTSIFFAVVSCCSLILCTYLIMLELFKKRQQSIITTIVSTAHPVWRVPFPSVTICNFNIVYRDSVKNVMNEVKQFGVDERVFMDIIYNLSSLIVFNNLRNISGYKEVYNLLEKHDYDTNKMMAKLAHPCESMIKKCIWQSQEVQCSKLFELLKTTNGYCCSFNYHRPRPTLKSGINSKKNTTKVQYHIGGAGPTLGLRLFLDIEKTQYISSIKPAYGLNVLVQDRVNFPDMGLLTNTLLPAEELSISVKPKLYVSSRNIRNVAPKYRHCLFEDEKNLKWTSIYNHKTCISECRASAILQLCDCVPFYYPHSGLEGKRTCTLLDVPCLQKNSYKYNALGLSESVLTVTEYEILRFIGNVTRCNCYPSCNERMYDMHTDRAKATPMARYQYTNMSMLNVYFNSIGCVKIKRDIYFTWDRVLGSIGGIFGFCLGGSIISILECFFFLVKCCHNCKKTKKKETSIIQYPKLYYINDFAHHYYGNRIQFTEQSLIN